MVLITGAKAEVQKMGPVKAELINEDYTPISKKKNAEPPIQNNTEQMNEHGLASFKNLIFPHGSRVKTVNMRFSQEVKLNPFSSITFIVSLTIIYASYP